MCPLCDGHKKQWAAICYITDNGSDHIIGHHQYIIISLYTFTHCSRWADADCHTQWRSSYFWNSLDLVKKLVCTEKNHNKPFWKWHKIIIMGKNLLKKAKRKDTNWAKCACIYASKFLTMEKKERLWWGSILFLVWLAGYIRCYLGAGHNWSVGTIPICNQ